MGNEFSGQNIAAEVLQLLPSKAEVTRIEYEGPRVAIYTKNPSYFMENPYTIGEIVNTLRKRVIVKADETYRKGEEYSRDFLVKLIPKEAGLVGIAFDGIFGEVIIDLKDTSVVEGEIRGKVEQVMNDLGWKVRIRRHFPLNSQVLQEMQYILKTNETERLQFLRGLGERVFRERLVLSNEVKASFLGGFREVGRSSILIETNESKVLMDCGVNLGARTPDERYPRFDLIDFRLEDLDAVILSHAHLDHSGFVPALFKYGYDGPVYCTEPTLTLSTMLLMDAIKVSQAEGGKPFYDMQNVREFIKHCITLPYGSVTDISPDIKLTMSNAGHILGSAVVHLHIGQGVHNIVYTGDYKFDRSRLFPPANYQYPRVETVITESTYGGRGDIMPPRPVSEGEFVSSINSTLKAGGKVLIPVPGVGRAQEMLLVLNDYLKKKELIEAPVFIEGMITEATGLHLLYPDYLERGIRDQIIHNGENPFLSNYITVIEHPNDREEVFAMGPAIIMATSGMFEGGPSVVYFKELAGDPKNKILFVSYQVAGTIGRRVLDGAKQISTMGNEGKINVVDVNCVTQKIEGFSGHSDYNQLMSFLAKFRGRAQRVIVAHGERRKVDNLVESLNRMYRGRVAVGPQIGESIRLN